MLTLLPITIFAAFFPLAAGDPYMITVDDADPKMMYTGEWVKNPIEDPAKLNWGGTMSYTNTSLASVDLAFEGGEPYYLLPCRLSTS